MKLKNNRRCGDFPWKNNRYLKQNAKEPKYFCENCFKLFRTGRFSRFDPKIIEDVCPNCGAVGLTLEELAKNYIDLWCERKLNETEKLENR